tara:strand:+ start:1086 stop:1442 length:357 start_codon:yes stop_codon:yes gene_type:complete
MYSWQGLVISMMFGVFLVFVYEAMKEMFLQVGIIITDRRMRKLMGKDKDFEEEIKEMTDSELHWMRVRDKHQAKMEEWRNRYPKGNMDNLSKETREELTIAIKEILEKEKLEDEQESK